MAARVASVRRDQGLPHAECIQFHMAPMDPPQDTVETLSDASGAPGIACLRKHKKHRAAAVRERSEKNLREAALQTPSPSRIMQKQISTLQPMENPILQQVDMPLKEATAQGELMLEQAPGRSCGP
ncbi:hypothetical protein llap_1791 [Limosa lapponica baueri]|uniref:Uncharacterized protein n=1 Tax=Limosa lapponica baueri TaxID=1758121 RepID=A0A2I0UPA2_LIMLA|nr:hypothetical protein llap_1791 [Limosa lapponica baueri]